MVVIDIDGHQLDCGGGVFLVVQCMLCIGCGQAPGVLEVVHSGGGRQCTGTGGRACGERCPLVYSGVYSGVYSSEARVYYALALCPTFRVN